MKFSPNNKYLLSVGRDRRWSIFENQTLNDVDLNFNFQLIATTDKKNGIHSRIIWTCDWSHDTKYFGTGSRDGKVVIWHRSDIDSKSSLGFYATVDTLELSRNDSITAFAFAQDYFDKDNTYLTAIGLETGYIHLYSFNKKWSKLHVIDRS